ncbi:ABC transporter ATP-binding protein [Agromyces soli]|uniref:ATP-binding cassette domain-containing protein n=1 Tax=Agromyces soli TaxID=659012 RepID=A0ABY4AV22_9MICO|nr:ATP-binding cassette domain-containing protein [Agromyces soli]UOE26855.1 ATP-binding cassette domain-containing protein [Agromyces soli]
MTRPGPALLRADGLSFRYEPGRPLLEGWSAGFDAGEVAAVTGPSGRGKSTLLYLLGLMLRPVSGEVLLDGEPMHARPDRERAARRAATFGFVFQDAALDSSRTVLDNVLETALYRGDDRRTSARRAHALLERFGVALRAEARPGQVSGGQAQRIALCRALLGDPRVLLADEPTGNLDPTSAEVVLEALHEQAQRGAAVVVVTHDPALVARCDRELVL